MLNSTQEALQFGALSPGFLYFTQVPHIFPFPPFCFCQITSVYELDISGIVSVLKRYLSMRGMCLPIHLAGLLGPYTLDKKLC